MVLLPDCHALTIRQRYNTTPEMYDLGLMEPMCSECSSENIDRRRGREGSRNEGINVVGAGQEWKKGVKGKMRRVDDA